VAQATRTEKAGRGSEPAPEPGTVGMAERTAALARRMVGRAAAGLVRSLDWLFLDVQ
jgi:hypothetical protein